jgi:hypothetical protein
MRKFLNQYGAYVGVGVLVIAGFLLYALNHKPAAKLPQKGYFVDEDTGEESVRPLTEVPPLTGTGGKETVVRAYKYNCDKNGAAKVAYYFKYTPEVKAKLQSLAGTAELGNYDPSNGELVRLPEKGSPWIPFKSTEAQKVITNFDCPAGHDISMMVPE